MTRTPKVGDPCIAIPTIQGLTDMGDEWRGSVVSVNGNEVEIEVPVMIDTDPDEKLVDQSKRYQPGQPFRDKVDAGQLQDDNGTWQLKQQVKIDHA